MSRLESPFIVHYLESGKSKRKDVYWFVTELLIGNPLDEVLDQQGPMPEMEAIKVRFNTTPENVLDISIKSFAVISSLFR